MEGLLLFDLVFKVRMEWVTRSGDPEAGPELEQAAVTMTAYHPEGDKLADAAAAVVSDEWAASDGFAVLWALTKLIGQLRIPKPGADLFLGPPLRDRRR